MLKKALLIGINYLDSPTNALNGCINDVINMRNMLIDAYGYDSTNITVLREDTDNKPTRTNIINSLTSIIAQSKNLKEIWIHYTGHGSQIDDVLDTKNFCSQAREAKPEATTFFVRVPMPTATTRR